MTVTLTFASAIQPDPGIVYSILSQCYMGILDTPFEERLRRFDRDVFENPDTVGVCTLISSLGGELVGLASYDPRQAPRVGILGHNGVLPSHRRKGYGTQQILEIVRLLAMRGCRRARVQTSEHPFFMPACKMYEACGFRESSRNRRSPEDEYRVILYEMPLTE
jgi:GNAT superfamily N-acetyltransferase